MARPFEVIVRVQSSWIEPSSWFHRGRGPVLLRWVHGAVWSRLRPRSSQYTAFTKPSFQTSRGRHAARETIGIESIPIYHLFQRDVALN
jgi:hypothetical protein